jgi:hypothetical protein
MIAKPAIIITSLGRTGTKFFAALFGHLLPDVSSLHEPDVFNFYQYRGAKERIRQTILQIREVGFYHLFFRKALGGGSLIELSDARVRHELEYSEAVRRLLLQRSRFVQSRTGSTYVESNVGYYGLIDVLSQTFEHHRTVYVIRDAHDWIRSHMNWGQMYNKSRIRAILAHTWPMASEIADDPYCSEWHSMSRFERLCWAWVRLNTYALGSVRANPSARTFRFEDVFTSDERYEHLTDLVNFAVDLPEVDPVPPRALAGWLDQVVHRSSGDFPAWSGWSTEDKQKYAEICGPLMEELRYGFN